MQPRVLFDRATGRRYRLSALGTAGGESQPCAVDGRDDLVGLVSVTGGAYPPEAGDKIIAIVDGNYTHPLIGFAVAVLVETHDPDAVMGFLVPKFEGTSLADLLVPGVLPDAHRGPLAALVVKAFEAAESVAIVTADNHPGNWLVEPDATGRPLAVRRIDPLAFVLYRGTQHTCPLAHPHYAEPEVQGKDISTLALGPKADRFALAVLLFEILVGVHPAMYGWAAEPDPAKRIAKRLFSCVSKLPADAKVRPAVTQAFAALPLPVQALLRRGLTRDRDERPSPAEWASALAPLAPSGPHAQPASPWAWRPDRAWVERHWRSLAAAALVVGAAATARVGTVGPTAAPAPAATYGLFDHTDRSDDPGPPPDPNAFRVLLKNTKRGNTP